MPALSHEVLRAVLPQEDNAPQAPAASSAYVPSSLDVKRAKERTTFAVELAKAGGVRDLVPPATITAESVFSLRCKIAKAKHDNAALKDNNAVRLANLVLIDAHRYLMGAADATSVPDADASQG